MGVRERQPNIREKPVFKLVTGKAVNLGLDEEGRKCHAHFT